MQNKSGPRVKLAVDATEISGKEIKLICSPPCFSIYISPFLFVSYAQFEQLEMKPNLVCSRSIKGSLIKIYKLFFFVLLTMQFSFSNAVADPSSSNDYDDDAKPVNLDYKRGYDEI